MTPDDSYEVPFQTDDDTDSQYKSPNHQAESELPDAEAAAELEAAKGAWSEETAESDDDQLSDLAQPYVGQWKELVSTTNWEKGRIIFEWRVALIEAGAEAQQYSDDAWARRVGGVTAPHVGRLRRVFDRYGSTFDTYDDLYWSHFLAALDWDDAPMWLEGASREGWSVAVMREKRWEALGAVESQRPTASEVIEVETDEDVDLPAQGGGRTREYGDEPDVASGPRPEEPDFGDEEELMRLPAAEETSTVPAPTTESADKIAIQPFAGLPDLPDDLSDAIEMLKLAVLRHKTAGWKDTDAATIQKYLDAISVLIKS